MPGHFTHIYTARRVADLLADGHFTDWPNVGPGAEAIARYSPEFCGTVMRDWPKFTALGAIGPDIFFFSEDWTNETIGPHSDELMLALATYFYLDAAMELDWEPLLIILEKVEPHMARLVRFLIRLQKAWNAFVESWNKTVGPLLSAVGGALDDLTGGLLSEFQVALNEFLVAIKNIGEMELTSYADLWGKMNTVIARGFPEETFLWSDMLHYRRTSATCEALVKQAEKWRDGSAAGEERFQQFFAFALGWIVHVGTDTIAHSFVNEQCGGPYRDHPARHHLIENHIDAWNYQQSAEGGTAAPPTPDPWGCNEDYPTLSMSALWFHVQLTPEDPQGKQRPRPLSTDKETRKAQLDVDGEMPVWLSEGITAALIETFTDHPHPKIYKGDAFQAGIDSTTLGGLVTDISGHAPTQPFQELIDGIAPQPSFPVPEGFPLPWEVGTAYKFMILLYKLNFNGTWELEKPRMPDFIIFPPASDFTNLFTPPDFSGIDPEHLIPDSCEVFIALVEWIVKELGDALTLLGDLIKMAMSPGSFLFRLGLYKLAMKIWDVAVKTHDVLAHTGILMPHSEQRYSDGELRLPNEIDEPLITLGGSIDDSFRQALIDVMDPLGNLDKDPSVIAVHAVPDPALPYYQSQLLKGEAREPWEFRRPWAYPNHNVEETNGVRKNVANGTETSEPLLVTDPLTGATREKQTFAGPYPATTTPDQVFFRTGAPVDADGRRRYETATTPLETDNANHDLIGNAREAFSPLGDPVPFSAYLIGRLANETGYEAQFNLDADRAYGYLTWDWIRDNSPGVTDLGQPYMKPRVAPQEAPEWDGGGTPMQLYYVDAPSGATDPPPVILLHPAGPGAGSDPAPGDVHDAHGGPHS